MNKAVPILVAIVLGGGVMGFLFVRAIQKSSTGTTDVVPVRSDVLQSDVADKIRLREVNGQIPVQVLPENFGRDDPFANF